MFKKLIEKYRVWKLARLIRTQEITPKGIMIYKYLKAKRDGEDVQKIEEYENFLEGKDAELTYLLLRAVIEVNGLDID